MEQNDSNFVIWFKIFIVWCGTTLGAMTLNNWVLLATLVYTSLQIVLSIRKLLEPPKKD